MSQNLRPRAFADLLLDICSATAVVAGLSVFTFHLLQPIVGVDDSNITLAYSNHLANGEGYRYNPGGEVVEGSTSLLWTVALVPFFWVSDSPERLVGIFCAVLSIATMLFAVRTARLCAITFGLSPPLVALATVASFGLFPAFFVWSVWSLMDLTLWVLLLTANLYFLTLFIGADEGRERGLAAQSAAYFATMILLPITRPEGAVFVVSSSVILGAAGIALRKPMLVRRSIGALTGALAALGVVTVWRQSYFGFPLPNTLYAKVSTGLWSQVEIGLGYLASFLSNPLHAAGIGVVSATALFLVTAYPFRSAIRSPRAWIAIGGAVYTWAILLFYVAAGGDHFGSHRFFQPLIPVMCVVIGLGVCGIGTSLALATTARHATAGACLLAALFVLLSQMGPFLSRKGDVSIEFQLAEEGRRMGAELNALAWSPSVGVIAAGGIRRTYRGEIYDLMGLNWVRMAHAVDDLTGTFRNHGAFDPEVLFESRPDVILPQIGPCSVSQYPSAFHRRVLKDVFSDPRFSESYVSACYRSLVFFVRRDRVGVDPGLTLMN